MSVGTPPHRVVITGQGAVTNIGADASSTWHAMSEGRSGIHRLEKPWIEKHLDQWQVVIGGECRSFDPTTHLDEREVRKLDRFAVLGISAAIEAVEDSGIDFGACDAERCGVIIGSGVGGIGTIDEGFAVLASKGPKRMNPFTVPKLMANAATGDISIRYGLRGHSSAHVTACASSGHSFNEAYGLIRDGWMDALVVGGAEGAIGPLCLAAFMTMKALSTRNEDPERASRPFDTDRDGFVLAEGAGVFVLESEEHARARGATIYAELLGTGVSSDASHITAPDEHGRGARRAMEMALSRAGLEPGRIDYVNAHGTSTPLGDSAEVAAVLELFGSHARKSGGGKLLMSSTKSMTGHTLGASGGVELIACLGAVREGVVAPTINLETPDAEFDIDLVPTEAREASVRYAMNNTFGFGGHNVSMVVGRYDG